jgi:heme exporter protein D
MDNFSDFLAMGGYAAYVWPAVGLTLVVLIGFVVTSVRRLRRTRRQLAKLEQLRLETRARRKTAGGGTP